MCSYARMPKSGQWHLRSWFEFKWQLAQNPTLVVRNWLYGAFDNWHQS
jgi:hypothetical protein